MILRRLYFNLMFFIYCFLVLIQTTNAFAADSIPLEIPKTLTNGITSPPKSPVTSPSASDKDKIQKTENKDEKSNTPVAPLILKKNYEYSSICLSESPVSFDLSENIKNKRLQLLEDKLKIAKAKEDKELISEVIFKTVEEYLKQGKEFKAENFLKNENPSQLSESKQIVLKGKILIAKNLYKEAKKNTLDYLEKKPKDIPALEFLITVNVALKNYPEAILTAEDLVKFNPKKSYLEELCRLSALNADHTQVSHYCSQLKKIEPTNYLAPIYMGISARDEENYPVATQFFKQSLKIKQSEFAQTCLAESYQLNNEFEKSIEAYLEALKIDERSVRAMKGLASVYLKKQNYDEALIMYRKACSINSDTKIEILKTAADLKNKKMGHADAFFLQAQKCIETKK